MDASRATRPIPLFLTALVAFFSALVALAVSNGHDARAHGDPAAKAHAMPLEEVALREEMRHLWEDHIIWTRLAIVSLTTESPDTEATVGRLLRNQTDIGNAVKPFYGKAAGAELTRQLRQHILIAADLIAAAQAGDRAELADAQARWTKNADGIAAVLSSVNPRHWQLAKMKSELRTHLRLTTEEAVARARGEVERGRRGLRQGAPPRAPLRRPALLGARRAVPEAVPLGSALTCTARPGALARSGTTRSPGAG